MRIWQDAPSRVLVLIIKHIALAVLCLTAHNSAAYEFRDKQDPFAVAPAPELDANTSTPPAIPSSSNRFSNLNDDGDIDRVVMVGYIGGANRACALVLDESNKSHCLRVGDELFRHSVSEVRNVYVKFRSPADTEIVHYLGGYQP